VDGQRQALEHDVEQGGTALGAFVGAQLVGIGSRLCDELDNIARRAGDAEMVVSATPSANTVQFYMGRGFEPTGQPLAELLQREPDDVHMDKAR
jgi:hypothetical protein